LPRKAEASILPLEKKERHVKPTRKVSRGSFMARISSAGHGAPGGKGKGAPASDHDLHAPPEKGAETDSDQASDAGGA